MRYSRKFIQERIFVCEITIMTLENEEKLIREAWEWWTVEGSGGGSAGRHLMISHKCILANLRSIKKSRDHWLREWDRMQGNPLKSENSRKRDSDEE